MKPTTMKPNNRRKDRWTQRRLADRTRARLDLEAWYRSEQDADEYRALSLEA
jgi:hypothetical protein